jgi:hypothetical protein
MPDFAPERGWSPVAMGGETAENPGCCWFRGKISRFFARFGRSLVYISPSTDFNASL